MFVITLSNMAANKTLSSQLCKQKNGYKSNPAIKFLPRKLKVLIASSCRRRSQARPPCFALSGNLRAEKAVQSDQILRHRVVCRNPSLPAAGNYKLIMLQIEIKMQASRIALHTIFKVRSNFRGNNTRFSRPIIASSFLSRSRILEGKLLVLRFNDK